MPENNTPSTLPEEFPIPFENAPATDLPILPRSDEDGSFDIDAALAAVASLHQIAGEGEKPEDTAADDTATAPEVANDFQDDFHSGANPILETGILPAVSSENSAAATVQATDFVRPELFILERGQAASVVPAVLLMAAGAWLTYTLVSGATVLPGQLLGLALAGMGSMLLAQWLSTSRFARGSFFAGCLLIGLGGLLLVLFQPGGSGWAGYPLALAVLGAAFLLTALFTMPRSGRLGFVGLAFVWAGLAGLSVTQGILDAALLTGFSRIAPIIAVFVALVLVAPLLRRRR